MVSSHGHPLPFTPTVPVIQRWTRTPVAQVALWTVSLLGFAIAGEFLVGRGLFGHGGDGGVDVLAYWDAGRHALHGHALYGNGGVGGAGAYLYPPPLAQLLALPALAPFPVFAWTWRALQLLCLRSVVGSWRATGIALAVFPLLIEEIDAGNVHLMMAAVLAALLRGNARGVLPAGALTKFAPLAALPLALRVDARAVVRSGIVIAAICIASAAADHGAWLDWLRLLSHPDSSQGAHHWGALPSVPLGVRLALAAALGIAALRWRRFVVPAVVLAYPVVWYTSLSTLVALVARRTHADVNPRV
jgi:hypothetical protein